MPARKLPTYTHIVRAARIAAKELQSRHGNEKRREACQPLADILLSDEPLVRGAREAIAALLMGDDIKRGKRQLAAKAARVETLRQMVREIYFSAKDVGKPISRDVAVDKVAEREGLSDKEHNALRRIIVKGRSILRRNRPTLNSVL